MGYYRAGFQIVGVDIRPQPNYPFRFIRADAAAFPLDGFDAYHASPPCQFATQMSARWRGRGGRTDEHTDLLTPTLGRFRKLSAPWVVENVVGARACFRNPFLLHGGMFGLGVHRPRLFESNCLVLVPIATATAEPVGVYGDYPNGRLLWTRQNGNGGKRSEMRAARSVEEARRVMGMDWGTWREVKEAIPPAYTEHIGRSLLLAAIERAA